MSDLSGIQEERHVLKEIHDNSYGFSLFTGEEQQQQQQQQHQQIIKKSILGDSLQATEDSNAPKTPNNLNHNKEESQVIKENCSNGLEIVKNGDEDFKENHIKEKFEKELNNISITSTNVLPDIVNIQPVEVSQNLPTSPLHVCNRFTLNSTKNLNYREDVISSDDELFSECQEFDDPSRKFETFYGNTNQEIDSNTSIEINSCNNLLKNVKIQDNTLSEIKEEKEITSDFNNSIEKMNSTVNFESNSQSNLTGNIEENLDQNYITSNSNILAVNSTMEFASANLTTTTTTEFHGNQSNEFHENEEIRNLSQNIEEHQLESEINTEKYIKMDNEIEKLSNISDENIKADYEQKDLNDEPTTPLREIKNLKEIKNLNDSYNDSFDSPVIHIPQILLRQKSKTDENIANNKSTENIPNIKIENDTKTIAPELEITCNGEIQENNIKTSVDGTNTESIAPTKTDIQLVIESANNHLVDESLHDGYEDAISSEVMSTASALKSLSDSFDPSILNRNVNELSSPVYLTFSASSEAINSTINTSLQIQKPILTNDSMECDNEKIPTNDATTHEQEEKTCELASNTFETAPLKNEQELNDQNHFGNKISQNLSEEELQLIKKENSPTNLQPLNSSNSNCSKNLYSSIEPMDVDDDLSPQKLFPIKSPSQMFPISSPQEMFIIDKKQEKTNIVVNNINENISENLDNQALNINQSKNEINENIEIISENNFVLQSLQETEIKESQDKDLDIKENQDQNFDIKQIENNLEIRNDFEVKCSEFQVEIDGFTKKEKQNENIENFNDFEFKKPIMFPPSNSSIKLSNKGFFPPQLQDGTAEDDFEANSGLILTPADFDFLLAKGSNYVPTDRNSLLLRFDPLLNHPVPVIDQHKQQHYLQQQQLHQDNQNLLQISSAQCQIPDTIKEDDENHFSPAIVDDNYESNQNEHKDININEIIPNSSTNTKNHPSTIETNSNQDTVIDSNSFLTKSFNNTVNCNGTGIVGDKKTLNLSKDNKGDDKMSVDVIQEMNNKSSIDSLSSQTTKEKEDTYKMEDLEKKIKNEVLKTEDIEKKLKESEQREEALLKRITEKDKAIAKMSGVIEAYEKAIAEFIAEKEQIKQNYEKQITELQADRDLNHQHLLSLETTFSDLHIKYERSKQRAEKLRKNEEDLLAERKSIVENLRLQEQRYEKMKNHALQQLEIANNKIDTLSKNHSAEVTRLKALLKKEEISRLSVTEQYQQKVRENEELVKICDELISGQGS